MIHRGIIPGKPVALSKLILDIKQLLVSCSLTVEYAFLTCDELHAVGPEPYRMPVLKLVNDRLLDLLDRQVKICYGIALFDIAQVIDRISPVHGLILRRRIDQADSRIKIDPYILIEELLGCNIKILNDLVVLIRHRKIELMRRLAECYREYPVDICHHLLTCLETLIIDLGSGLFGTCDLTELRRIFPKKRRQILIDPSRILRVLAVRIHIRRYDSVFINYIREHIPLPAVAYRICRQECEQSAVYRLVLSADHIIQKPVGLLEFVVEEYKALRQFECLEIVLLHNLVSERIKRREYPAASRALLIGYLPLLKIDGESERQFVYRLKVRSRRCHTCSDRRI